MSRPDLEPVRGYVLGRLRRELAAELTYHNLVHTTDEVVPAVLRLAPLCGVVDPALRLLEVAALFHDLGFVERSAGHERASCAIARRVLPRFGFRDQEIDTVTGIILATELPQKPRDLLGRILADADLDVLGREDFLIRNQALRSELENAGQTVSDEEWYRQQLAFLESHTYFTQAARSLRDDGKRRNIEALRRRLAAAVTAESS